MLSMFVLFLSLFATSSIAAGRKPDFRPLESARADLKAPAYSAAERELVVDQAIMFIKNMYVHRELKIKDFGVSADGLPRLEDVRKKAASMDDQIFHETMQKIFLDLRDHHTNYGAPLPLACSYVLAPLVFTDIVEQSKTKIVVEGISRIFDGVDGEYTRAEVGDELVAVDGISIEDYLDILKAESGGANPDAMTAFGLMNLTIRSLSELPVPKTDSLTFTLKGSSGTYTVTSDYYALVNEESCVSSLKSDSSERSATDMEDPRHKVWRELVAPTPKISFAVDPLNEIAFVKDLKTASGHITYVQLFSFMPENQSIESLIHRLIEVLKARQARSQGLIIDVRGNGGGAVKLAEDMIQLFTPAPISTMPVRLLANELNLNVFLKANHGANNGWTSDIRGAISKNEVYTAPRVLTTSGEANRFGQIWFKPVVVLTDATCYSACDIFAAGMQDHSSARVVGTHASTGAGGANVMEYDAFRAMFDVETSDNPFVALPHHQSMRVSWRQVLRTGKNAGKLIENAGVTPDVVIRNTKDDIGTNASKRLLATVAKMVLEMAPNYKSSLKLASTVRMENDKNAAWSEDATGIDRLDIVFNGKVLRSVSVNPAGERLDIELGGVKGTWENKRLELIGRLNGKVTLRVMRELFWRGDDVKLTSAGLTERLDGPLKYLKTHVAEGTVADQWQTSEGILRVGKGPLYNPNIVTEAFVPLDVSGVKGKVFLNIDFKLESEEGMDTFSIFARDPDTGVENYLFTIDGSIDLPSAEMIAIPNNGKRVEIVLEFESDENWNMAGPEIRKLEFKRRAPSILDRR